MAIDYLSFRTGKPAETRTIASADDLGYWWKVEDANDRAKRLVMAAHFLKQDQSQRSEANLRHMRLYDIELAGFGPRDYSRATALLSPRGAVALNVVAAAVDTLGAKISKHRPRPSFQTSGAGWKMQQKARRLDLFTRGLFYETKIYRVGDEVFLDGGVLGTGAVKFYVDPETRRICAERAFPEELYVDDADAIYGHPRQMFQRKRVSKEVVLGWIRKKKLGPEAEHIVAGSRPPDDTRPMRGFGDLIEVWEGWHLPSAKGAGDGLHVIAIDGLEISSEPWTRPYFPFAFFKCFPRMLGFWAQGVAERLQGIQLELNRLMRSVSEQLRRKGRGRIFCQVGSKIVPSHLTNGIADVVFFNGTPPVVDNANAVAPEEFMQIERLYVKAFQEVGLSELSVAAKKPSGLDAAVALREYSDIESERFVKLSQRWEQFYLDCAEIMLDMIRDRGGDGYKVRLPNKRFTVEVDWKDIDLDRDSFTMQMFPVSSLPQTPAARLQRVEELRAKGYITDAVAKRLLDFPDIEAENHLGNAAIDDVDATISAILDDETPRFMAPDKYSNLLLMIERATAAYLFAKHHGADEERLDMLRQLIDQAASMVLATQPPAPVPGPGAAPPAPAGMPSMNISASPQIHMPAAPTVPPLVQQ